MDGEWTPGTEPKPPRGAITKIALAIYEDAVASSRLARGLYTLPIGSSKRKPLPAAALQSQPAPVTSTLDALAQQVVAEVMEAEAGKEPGSDDAQPAAEAAGKHRRQLPTALSGATPKAAGALGGGWGLAGPSGPASGLGDGGGLLGRIGNGGEAMDAATAAAKEEAMIKARINELRSERSYSLYIGPGPKPATLARASPPRPSSSRPTPSDALPLVHIACISAYRFAAGGEPTALLLAAACCVAWFALGAGG